MPPQKVMTIRLSPAHRKLLSELSKKTGISSHNEVLRLALTRLAEAEGLIKSPKNEK